MMPNTIIGESKSSLFLNMFRPPYTFDRIMNNLLFILVLFKFYTSCNKCSIIRIQGCVGYGTLLSNLLDKIKGDIP